MRRGIRQGGQAGGCGPWRKGGGPAKAAARPTRAPPVEGACPCASPACSRWGHDAPAARTGRWRALAHCRTAPDDTGRHRAAPDGPEIGTRCALPGTPRTECGTQPLFPPAHAPKLRNTASAPENSRTHRKTAEPARPRHHFDVARRPRLYHGRHHPNMPCLYRTPRPEARAPGHCQARGTNGTGAQGPARQFRLPSAPCSARARARRTPARRHGHAHEQDPRRGNTRHGRATPGPMARTHPRPTRTDHKDESWRNSTANSSAISNTGRT